MLFGSILIEFLQQFSSRHTYDFPVGSALYHILVAQGFFFEHPTALRRCGNPILVVMGTGFSRYGNPVQSLWETLSVVMGIRFHPGRKGWDKIRLIIRELRRSTLTGQSIVSPVIPFGIPVEGKRLVHPFLGEDTGYLGLLGGKKRALLVHNAVISGFGIDTVQAVFQRYGRGVGNLVEQGGDAPSQLHLAVTAEVGAGVGILGIGGGVEGLKRRNAFGGVKGGEMPEAFVLARACRMETMKVVEGNRLIVEVVFHDILI